MIEEEGTDTVETEVTAVIEMIGTVVTIAELHSRARVVIAVDMTTEVPKSK